MSIYLFFFGGGGEKRGGGGREEGEGGEKGGCFKPQMDHISLVMRHFEYLIFYFPPRKKINE